MLEVGLTALPAGGRGVVVTAGVDAAAAAAGTTFAAVRGITVRVADRAGPELASFRPDGLGAETTLNLVERYLADGEWKVRAVGQGLRRGPAGIARDPGISVAGEPGPPGRTRLEKGVAGFPADAVDDLDRVSDEVLDDRLPSEVPDWLRAARAAGVLG